VVDFALDVLSETLRYFTVIVILTLQAAMFGSILVTYLLIPSRPVLDSMDTSSAFGELSKCPNIDGPPPTCKHHSGLDRVGLSQLLLSCDHHWFSLRPSGVN